MSVSGPVPFKSAAGQPLGSTARASASQSTSITKSQGLQLNSAAEFIANAVSASGDQEISVTNLGILLSHLDAKGIEDLKEHVNSLTDAQRKALVESAVQDVASGGHNLQKLLNLNPEIFKTVVHAGENRSGEPNRLIKAMDTHSAKIPHALLSAASSHLPTYIVNQCTTKGAHLLVHVDFDKGAKMIARFFDMGVMSLHQALGSITGLQSADAEGAESKTGKEHVPEVLDVLRDMVGIQGCAELRDGLAIKKQFEAMSRPGGIAVRVLDRLKIGNLEDKGFRDSVNEALKEGGISLQFTGKEPNDTSVQEALKVISKQTGAGSGGDEMIFDRLTRPELKELKAMALLPDGQTQIEARLNRYSGATPKAATAIATACMETLKPNVDKAAVKRLVKQLDSRIKICSALVNFWQKNFSPEQYKERKLDKLETLVNNIQKKVNENRLIWNKETRTLAVAMVRQKITQYIAQLDKLGSSPEVKEALKEQRDALLGKIGGVISKLNLDTSTMTVEGQAYDIGAKIFQGTVANVHHCVNKKTNELFVVKLIKVSDMTVRTIEALQQVQMAQKFSSHPNIMSHSAVAITGFDDVTEAQTMAIVMPFADKGDIEQVVAELEAKPLAEKTPVFLQLLTDAATGLCAIHEQGFLHGDIKPANIFVKTGADGKLIGMVGDLGSAQHQSEFKHLKMAGTYPYMPDMPAGTTVDLSVDSYAFGMMTFELLSGGEFPFSETIKVPGVNTPTLPALPELHARIDALPNASDRVKFLIERSLSAVPENRPTMREWRDALSASSVNAAG